MSTQPQITICPPGPQDVHFDPHAFSSAAHSVSQETRLAWSDVRSMHTEFHPGKRGVKRWIPLFANNDAQLRHVIAEAVWKHMHIGGSKCGSIPAGLVEDRVILEQMCIATDKKRAKKLYSLGYGRNPSDETAAMWTRHVGSVELIGSYMVLITTIAYRSWRLHQDSPTIAQQMGLTAVGVRQLLYRLVRTARKLGYETHSNPHWDLGKRGIRPRTPHRVKLPPGPQLVQEVEADGYKAVAARYDVLRISVYKAYAIAELGHAVKKRPRRKRATGPVAPG